MQKQHLVCVSLLLVAMLPTCLQAQTFFSRKDIPIGERPRALAVGDFNGDSLQDLAVATRDTPYGLVILLNQGKGNLGQPIRNAAVGDLLVVGDFDNDGRDDLANRDGILLSQGDGTFLAPYALGSTAYQSLPVATADFNGDGWLDLIVEELMPLGVPGDESVRVWLAAGNGNFLPGPMLSADPLRQVVVADFNRDGLEDLVMLPISAPNDPLRVVLGQGDGTFGPDKSIPIDAFGLLTADFNGDGLPDLATSASCAICEEGTTGILLGNGDGSFQRPVSYPSWDDGAAPVAAADLTGDDKADLVVVYNKGSSIFVFPGAGDGTLLAPTEHSVGWGPHSVASVDLDGDARLDLATVNFWGANTVSVLLAKEVYEEALPRALSAASYTAIVAPGSLATLFAATPATGSSTAIPPSPTQLAGISLEIRDSTEVTHLAPLLFVSPTQINFQVPADISLGEATLTVVSAGESSVAGSMQVDEVAPGLFMMSHPNLVPAATAMMVIDAGTQLVPVFACSPETPGACTSSPIPLSTAGDRPIYLSFYGTGLNGTTVVPWINPSDDDYVTCSINDRLLPIEYAGPQGDIPGLDQINVRLLPELLEESEEGLYGPGQATVTIRVGGVIANSAMIDIR